MAALGPARRVNARTLSLAQQQDDFTSEGAPPPRAMPGPILHSTGTANSTSPATGPSSPSRVNATGAAATTSQSFAPLSAEARARPRLTS